MFANKIMQNDKRCNNEIYIKYHTGNAKSHAKCSRLFLGVPFLSRIKQECRRSRKQYGDKRKCNRTNKLLVNWYSHYSNPFHPPTTARIGRKITSSAVASNSVITSDVALPSTPTLYGTMPSAIKSLNN